MKEGEEKTVHWITTTGQYSGLTIACGLWRGVDRYEYTAYHDKTTCGNCKRTKGFLKG